MLDLQPQKFCVQSSFYTCTVQERSKVNERAQCCVLSVILVLSCSLKKVKYQLAQEQRLHLVLPHELVKKAEGLFTTNIKLGLLCPNCFNSWQALLIISFGLEVQKWGNRQPLNILTCWGPLNEVV